MYALALAGCVAPLVDERVIEADVVSERVTGPVDSRLGADVAVGPGDAWGASAPGVDAVLVDDTWAEGPSWVGWAGTERVEAARDGRWWRDGAEQPPVEGARRWAAGPAGVVAWDGVALRLDGGDRAVGEVAALAVGEVRVYAIVCASACEAVAWEGAEEVARWPAGQGGAVGEWDGRGWAGDPEDGLTEGAGRACAEDGACVAGEPGDHLGGAIGGGYAAGVYNSRIVPARARIVPLADGPVYALERGAENQPHALAGDADRLVVGAPYYPAEGGAAGLVARVPR